MAARQRPPPPPTPKICNCCGVSEDIKIFYITGEGYMCKHCCTNESGRARRCRCKGCGCAARTELACGLCLYCESGADYDCYYPT
jgi:hypothetical protein